MVGASGELSPPLVTFQPPLPPPNRRSRGRLWRRPSASYLSALPWPSRRRPPNGGGTIETLTTRQRAHLKSLAHSLKPIHHIGKEGVTDRTLDALREAFHTRELLKVKVQDSAPDAARETGEALVERLDDAYLVQVIGRTLVLYRPDPEEPAIELP